MHCHLVSVEVRVEGGTNKRMQLDGRTLDQANSERLNAQPVQGGGAVEEHEVVLNDLFEHFPNALVHPLYQPLGCLDVVSMAMIDEPAHHERLEQFQRHALRQSTLVEREIRTNHDDRSTGIVDTLAEQVLAEPPLLALEHVRETLQLMLARARNDTA